MRILLTLAAVLAGLSLGVGEASHGGSGWQNKPGPLELSVYTNTAGTEWEQDVVAAGSDWNLSPDVDLTLLPLESNCGLHRGKITVCGGDYGAVGWFGRTTLRYQQGQIVAVYVQLNSYYRLLYNPQQAPCHELGHALGLSHFPYNPDVPTQSCMTTSTGPIHPDLHDYEMLTAMYGD